MSAPCDQYGTLRRCFRRPRRRSCGRSRSGIHPDDSRQGGHRSIEKYPKTRPCRTVRVWTRISALDSRTRATSITSRTTISAAPISENMRDDRQAVGPGSAAARAPTLDPAARRALKRSQGPATPHYPEADPAKLTFRQNDQLREPKYRNAGENRSAARGRSYRPGAGGCGQGGGGGGVSCETGRLPRRCSGG